MRRFFALAVFLIAAPVGAQTLAPPLQVKLSEALQLTAQNDPRLQGQKFLTQAAAARRAQASLRPALKVTAEVENALGTGALSSTNDIEATLSLGATLELGSKRAKRMSMAEQEAAKLEAELQAARLDVFAGVAHRFIAVLRAQENVAVARDDRALDARLQAIVAARVASAAGSAIERSNAEVAAVQAALAEQSAEADLREAWGMLVVAWGGAPESQGRALGDLFAAPAPPEFSGLEDMVNRNPEILTFAAERRVREAALNLAQAQAAPDIDVAAGIRRLEALNEQAFVFSASIPLGSTARAAPGAEEARSRLRALETDERARRLELLGLLHGLRQRAANAAVAMGQIQSAALPAARRAQEQAEAAFRLGRSSLMELTAAQHQLFDLRRARIDAATNYHLAVIELERLIGAPISNISPTAATTGAP